MSLHNVNVSSSDIIALENDSYIESEVTAQLIMLDDFRKITNCKVHYNLLNIMCIGDINTIKVSKKDVTIDQNVLILFDDDTFEDYAITSVIATNIIDATDMHGTSDDTYSDGYDIDISAIGKTPIKVYILPKISFNGLDAIENVDNRYIASSGKCVVDMTLTLPATREVYNRIDFNLDGNVVNEVYYELKNIKLKEVESNTDNNSPTNTISVQGTDAPLSDDAYLLFTGSETETVNILCDETGIVDVDYIYEFLNPTIVYKISILTLLKEQSLKSFKFYGSHNNVDYVELISEEQSLSIDNLNNFYKIKPDLQDEYKYYKFQIIEGPISNNLKIGNLKLFIEDI